MQNVWEAVAGHATASQIHVGFHTACGCGIRREYAGKGKMMFPPGLQYGKGMKGEIRFKDAWCCIIH